MFNFKDVQKEGCNHHCLFTYENLAWTCLTVSNLLKTTTDLVYRLATSQQEIVNLISISLSLVIFITIDDMSAAVPDERKDEVEVKAAPEEHNHLTSPQGRYVRVSEFNLNLLTIPISYFL